jgi:hypothetical protein
VRIVHLARKTDFVQAERSENAMQRDLRYHKGVASNVFQVDFGTVGLLHFSHFSGTRAMSNMEAKIENEH